MSDRLSEIFSRQIGLQQMAYGKDLAATAKEGGEALAQEIKDNILALTDELHEALAEVGWKPWATSRHINNEAFLSEMVDALHFFVNLYALGGGTPDDLFKRYCEKNNRNMERQIKGYDGVAGKCPGCKRALDDPYTPCQNYPNAGYVYCHQTEKRYARKK